LYFQIISRVRNNEKIFGKKIEEAITPFLKHKKKQVGVGNEITIVIGRYKTIEAHLRHFVRYIGANTKITDLSSNFLTSYYRDGELSDYVSYRSNTGSEANHALTINLAQSDEAAHVRLTCGNVKFY